MNVKPILAIALASASLFAAATGNRPVTKNAKSPTAETTVALAGKNITIEYNAPSARGREVEGGLIPFGNWWRLGADTSTTLTAESDIKIGDISVPKGVYSMYVEAKDAKSWELIINKQTKQWGTEYNKAQDLGRTALKLAKSTDMIETMKITLKPAGSAATLEIAWGHTVASVPVK